MRYLVTFEPPLHPPKSYTNGPPPPVIDVPITRPAVVTASTFNSFLGNQVVYTLMRFNRWSDDGMWARRDPYNPDVMHARYVLEDQANENPTEPVPAEWGEVAP